MMHPLLFAISLKISTWMAVAAGAAAAGVLSIVFSVNIPLKYNIRNLALRWRTTLLTALAFTCVVGLLVVMLAFVNGMARLTEQSGQPGNVMILSDGATDEAFSNLGYSDVSDVARVQGVEKLNEKPLASFETYMIVNQLLPAEEGKPARRRFVQLRGVDDSEVAGAVHGLPLLEGRWMPADDAGVQDNPNQKAKPLTRAIVGSGLAARLGSDVGRPPLKVGDVFELAEREWIVHGVIASAGSTFDSELWAKRSLVAERFGKSTYTTVVVRTKGPAEAKKLADYFKTDYTKAKLSAQPETEYFASLSGTNAQFTYAIGFIAVFMAVGGIFGVMNTMFAAIAQRTKDIGVLRIVGYSRTQVLTSFFLESLLLAILGGLLGCALASLVDGVSRTSLVGNAQGGAKTVVFRLVIDANALGLGMLFAIFMGAVGGLVPAMSAMRLRPLESMR